jgi:GalNAc-alpha-(1->4)-GalNAc-alpha-(1->3)-diNAcBac-PP-undecaprenol alpha-1,4-N-acetyl-D-galactosaminyltransferase
MKITFVISSLNRGGAEKILVMMANHFFRHKHHVSVMTWDDGQKPPMYKLDDGIFHRTLNLAGESSSLWTAAQHNRHRVQCLRSAISAEAPHLILSFMEHTNVITLLASIGLGVPVIVLERNDPHAWPREKIWRFLRTCLYPWADRIVVQTEDAKNYFPRYLRSKIQCIPNPVPEPSDGLRAPQANVILAVGRLESYKRFDLLMRAVSKLPENYSDWELIIVGDGSARPDLIRLRETLGLQQKVKFLGDIVDVTPYFRNASLFVLPSDFDGFPNALCEAMACGLPVIASDNIGAKAIVRDGVDGLLFPVGDLDALIGSLKRLLSNEQERQTFGQNARSVTTRFSVEKIATMWDDLLLHFFPTV